MVCVCKSLPIIQLSTWMDSIEGAYGYRSRGSGRLGGGGRVITALILKSQSLKVTK